MPPVGVPLVAIVCTALQQALDIRCTVAVMPSITAVAGTAKPKLVASSFEPVATAAIVFCA